MGATNTKKSKYTFAKIPGVPGCVYYLMVNGKNRSLMCTSADDKIICLSDLDDGYTYKWCISHFSYMLRQRRWKDPSLVPTQEIKVERYDAKRPAFMTREYTEKDFDGLIDDIDNITF